MVFKTMKELEKYILSHSKVAIERARDKVCNIINHFLTQYYNEYDPEVYVRTYRLLHSLVKTRVKKDKNGWVAEVYFDFDKLNYSKRIVPQGQPWTPWATPESTFHRDDWTKENDEWVFETAMTGRWPHGGYASGTAIWTESTIELSNQKIEILKQALEDAGIPIK